MKAFPCKSCGSDLIGYGKVLRAKDMSWLPHKWFCECQNCYRRGETKWTRRRAMKSWNAHDGVDTNVTAAIECAVKERREHDSL